MTRSTRSPRALPTDAVVRWRDGFRPLAAADVTGTVFSSVGRNTFVIWAGTSRPQQVATIALTVVK